MWPTIRWSGRTLRPGDVPSTLERLEGLDVVEPVPRATPARAAAPASPWAGRRPTPRRAPGRPPGACNGAQGSGRSRTTRSNRSVAVATDASVPLPQSPAKAGSCRRIASMLATACSRCSGPQLVGHDAPVGPDRSAQRDRERSRPRAGFQHPRAGEDVGLRDDRAQVLRVDDLRAAGHLQDEVGEPRSERHQHHPFGGANGAALGRGP